MKENITYERVKELFGYHGGKLVRRIKTRGGPVGSPIGHINHEGYIAAVVDGKDYLVHRLIWLWKFGYFPENGIDHINRDRTDNRVENLRETSRSCNIRNSKQRNGTTSGVKGVFWCNTRNKWTAVIKINGKLHYIGSSTDKIQAICMRLVVEQCVNWSSCENRSPAAVFIYNLIKR